MVGWVTPLPDSSFFTDDEKKAVTGVFDCIVPGDRNGAPAASECSVAHFVDKLLARGISFHPEIGAWQSLYRAGLKSLERAAMDAFGKPTAELNAGELTGLLSKLENGALANWGKGPDQRIFFLTLRRHCIQGCFADPRWGGNTDGKMWNWFGYQVGETRHEGQ